MSTTTTVTVSDDSKPIIVPSVVTASSGETYRYAHLLPHFSQDHYPPLTPYEHVDPGSRALSSPDPRAFLRNASSVVELTPNLGTEVHGNNSARSKNAD